MTNQLYSSLTARLQSRLPEIYGAIYVRINEVAPHPITDANPEYQAGVRATIAAIVEHSLESMSRGVESSDLLPPVAAAQARHAARADLGLGTVLRRYLAGHRRLGEFIADEADRSGLSIHGPTLYLLRRRQELQLEELTAAVESEYNQELERIAYTPEQRRSAIVRNLLSGEIDPVELVDLDYEIHSSWHLGLIAAGTGVANLLETLRVAYGRSLLSVLTDGVVWGWLGVCEEAAASNIRQLASNEPHVSLAVGELGYSVDGWRLTHHQAKDALAVAAHKSDRFVRYAENRLLATTLKDDTAAKSLTQRYLEPLRRQRDGGLALRQTLRTYIALECNATSAGHALNLGRRGVVSRVRTAEKLFGCALGECLAELDVALRLEDLAGNAADRGSSP